jgi:hypothetical protein
MEAIDRDAGMALEEGLFLEGVAFRSLLRNRRHARRDVRLPRKAKPEISGPMN